MKAIFGLGNPGSQYEGTRHNAGFEIIEALNNSSGLSSTNFKLDKARHADTVKTQIAQQPVLLAKPITYMNESGKSLVEIRRFYKIPLNDFLIIHDDISLPLGKIRLQQNGGAGGQHGVESIIEYLGGDKKFDRLKIGIGPDPGGDVRHEYVLQKFSVVERNLLNDVIDVSVKAVLCWLTDGIDKAMNDFNGFSC